jgi:SAM-dependent methyltransferase
MKSMWDSRYESEEYVYGKEANSFFASELEKINPGKILLPGEGEGRNAVFAASLGWEVIAYDQSEEGKNKALRFAKERGVRIDYRVQSLEDYKVTPSSFDAVGLCFFHAAPPLRKLLHHQVQEALKPGGKLILEAFHTSQINNNTGGPQAVDMLFDKSLLETDFSSLELVYLEEKSVLLNEGPFHQGEASIIRLLGKKPI